MELLLLFLEFAAEFFLEFLAEGMIEAATRTGGKSAPLPRPLVIAIYTSMSLLLAILSLQVFPHHFIRNPEYRVWNLIITPVALGIVMGEWGSYLRRSGKRVVMMDSYLHGFLVAMIFAAVRFFWAA